MKYRFTFPDPLEGSKIVIVTSMSERDLIQQVRSMDIDVPEKMISIEKDHGRGWEPVSLFDFYDWYTRSI